MSGFRTVLTYSAPIDAEVDKSMLRSEGIAANLLNRESSLNGVGGPFCVELQVPEEQLALASDLIRSKRPERFGRTENLVCAEAAIRRGIRRFLWFAAFSILLIYSMLLIAKGTEALTEPIAIAGAIVVGLFVSIPFWLVYEFFRKLARQANHLPDPTCPPVTPPAGAGGAPDVIADH